MNILITGCNGQLGSELRRLQNALPHSHCFFNTDREELDITSLEAIEAYISTHKIDLIVNCAAYTAVDQAEQDEAGAELLNHKAPAFLAEAMERRGASIIQVSTDYVFDGCACRPYNEEAATVPNSVYGATKLRGEVAVMQRCKRSVVVRTAWLYSAHGNNFVKTMLRLGKERAELGVVADQVGTPTHAADLAHAIWTMIEKGLVPGIYHYSNEGVTSWYDFAKAIHRIAGITSCQLRPLSTEEYPAAAPRPSYSVLNKRKIKAVYGLTIPWWEESLSRCIAQLQSSESEL